MDCRSYEAASDPCLVKPKPCRHRPRLPKTSSPSSPSWFDLRVFYVRISNITVGASTPEYLTLTLTPTPLAADTLLEVNGARPDSPASLLRRDRIGRRSREATFVGTDCVRLTGSLKFEVFHRDDSVLSGALELSDGGRWSMSCEAPQVGPGLGFLNVKPPTAEVYVAGLFAATPVILTEVVQLGYRKRQQQCRKTGVLLDSIPENESTQERAKDCSSPGLDPKTAGAAYYRNHKSGYEEDEDDAYEMYWRTQYVEGENGELSWFNAGVRVGVGIGLGISLGVGIGIGLLVQTARGFKRRLL